MPKTKTDDKPTTGYVWVQRTVTTVEGEDRAPGYVNLPDAPQLVDAKSVPELEVMGYRIVDAPKDETEDKAKPKAPAKK